MSVDNSVVRKYQAGFRECAGEVSRYLKTIDGLDPEVRDRLIGHLAGCIHRLNTVGPQVVGQGHQSPRNPEQQQLSSNPAVTFNAVSNHPSSFSNVATSGIFLICIA